MNYLMTSRSVHEPNFFHEFFLYQIYDDFDDFIKKTLILQLENNLILKFINY